VVPSSVYQTLLPTSSWLFFSKRSPKAQSQRNLISSQLHAQSGRAAVVCLGVWATWSVPVLPHFSPALRLPHSRISRWLRTPGHERLDGLLPPTWTMFDDNPLATRALQREGYSNEGLGFLSEANGMHVSPKPPTLHRHSLALATPLDWHHTSLPITNTPSHHARCSTLESAEKSSLPGLDAATSTFSFLPLCLLPLPFGSRSKNTAYSSNERCVFLI
jgi:hypothetical protein